MNCNLLLIQVLWKQSSVQVSPQLHFSLLFRSTHSHTLVVSAVEVAADVWYGPAVLIVVFGPSFVVISVASVVEALVLSVVALVVCGTVRVSVVGLALENIVVELSVVVVGVVVEVVDQFVVPVDIVGGVDVAGCSVVSPEVEVNSLV